MTPLAVADESFDQDKNEHDYAGLRHARHLFSDGIVIARQVDAKAFMQLSIIVFQIALAYAIV